MLSRKPIKIAMHYVSFGPAEEMQPVDFYITAFMSDATQVAIMMTEHNTENIITDFCVNLEMLGVYPAYHCVFIKEFGEWEGYAYMLHNLGIVELTGRGYKNEEETFKALEGRLLLADDVWAEFRNNFIVEGSVN